MMNPGDASLSMVSSTFDLADNTQTMSQIRRSLPDQANLQRSIQLLRNIQNIDSKAYNILDTYKQKGKGFIPTTDTEIEFFTGKQNKQIKMRNAHQQMNSVDQAANTKKQEMRRIFKVSQIDDSIKKYETIHQQNQRYRLLTNRNAKLFNINRLGANRYESRDQSLDQEDREEQSFINRALAAMRSSVGGGMSNYKTNDKPHLLASNNNNHNYNTNNTNNHNHHHHHSNSKRGRVKAARGLNLCYNQNIQTDLTEEDILLLPRILKITQSLPLLKSMDEGEYSYRKWEREPRAQ